MRMVMDEGIRTRMRIGMEVMKWDTVRDAVGDTVRDAVGVMRWERC